MRLSGIEIKNFRSIGDEFVSLNPLRKCNILIGRNNSGKSNIIRGISKALEKTLEPKTNLDEIDYHNRQQIPFEFILHFSTNPIPDNQDNEILSKTGIGEFWFQYKWGKDAGFGISDSNILKLVDFRIQNSVLSHFTGQHWTAVPSAASIQRTFHESMKNIFTHFIGGIKPVIIIPEFRKIEQGESYSIDGKNLIRFLNQLKFPQIGKDEDQRKFEKIQDICRRLLHLPDCALEIIEVQSQNPILAINNDGLRLPLSHYGTGTHELIILVTAVTSLENSICCIEEPEIHLHPRAQIEFLDYLIHDTSNDYLITTHSPTLINYGLQNELVQVVHLFQQNGVTRSQRVDCNTDGIKALYDLGNKPSDLMQANSVIWVEGYTDVLYLRKWLTLCAPNLVEGRDFVFITYREFSRLNLNHNLVQEKLTNVFQLNPSVILVMDSDLKNDRDSLDIQKIEFKNTCEQSGGLVWITKRREIENYIPVSVISKCFPEITNEDIRTGHYEDIVFELNKALKRKRLRKQDLSKSDLAQMFVNNFCLEDISEELREEISHVITQIETRKS